MKLTPEAIALIRDAVRHRMLSVKRRAEAHEINGNAKVAMELRRYVERLQDALAQLNTASMRVRESR